MKSLSKYINESLFDGDIIKTDPLEKFKKSLMDTYGIRQSPKNKKDVETAVLKWVDCVTDELSKYYSKDELKDALTTEVIYRGQYQNDGEMRCQHECPETLIDKHLLMFELPCNGSLYSWNNEDKEWQEY